MANPEVHIDIFDTTLRDGAQALPATNQFAKGMKPQIAHDIARLGVAVIEAGFPVTPSDANEVESVAQTVGQHEYESREWHSFGCNVNSRSPRIAGLCRANNADIDTAMQSLEPARLARIHTFISTDEAHMRAKFPDKSPAQVLCMGVGAVRYARSLADTHPNMDVEFSAEAATTTDMDYLERVVKEAIQAGASVINVPDTVGQRDPFWMRGFYSNIIMWVMGENPNVIISAHNHNDLNLATANSLALVHAATGYAHERAASINIQIEGTICGIGERAGNSDHFPFVAGLHKFTPEMTAPVRWRFNPEMSVGMAQAVLGDAGIQVDRQSPIVGNDTLVHRSGIHSDGVIKGGYSLYTPHDPTFWGHNCSARHEDGRYQGKAGRQAARSL